MECSVNDFILQAYLHQSDMHICDSIIEYHKNSYQKFKGSVSGGYKPEVKNSTDVYLENSLHQIYVDALQKIVNLYIEKFKWSAQYAAWRIKEKINIQHYLPNQGFKAWHCERGQSIYPYTTRHLVFMTYLNDVYDAGETEWFHQNLKIQPRKGLTVIWPADWTHTHRGIVSSTEEKYIVTGWFNYVSN